MAEIVRNFKVESVNSVPYSYIPGNSVITVSLQFVRKGYKLLNLICVKKIERVDSLLIIYN